MLCSVAQSCPALCDPIDYSPPGFSVHGIIQARILEYVAISYSNTDFMFYFFISVDRTRYSLWKKYYHTVLVSILLLWLHFWCLLLVLSLLSNPYIFISSGFGIKIAILLFQSFSLNALIHSYNFKHKIHLNYSNKKCTLF